MADATGTAERRIAELDGIAEPGTREFTAGDGDWPFRGFVVRWEGQVYAYANTCPHQGHPLNFDADRFFARDKQLLLCSSHGALFEPDTGVCVAGPCADAALVKLKCRIENGAVYVTSPDNMR